MKKLVERDLFLAIEGLRRQAGRLRILITRPHAQEIENVVLQFSLQLVSIATEIDEAIDVVIPYLPGEVKENDFRRG